MNGKNWVQVAYTVVMVLVINCGNVGVQNIALSIVWVFAVARAACILLGEASNAVPDKRYHWTIYASILSVYLTLMYNGFIFTALAQMLTAICFIAVLELKIIADREE